MSTNKRRINITADADMEHSLDAAAKRDRVPVATKAAELLRLALEIEEDLALGAIAMQRLAQKGKPIPHHLAWK